MAELIAAGTTEVDSADFTLASGDQVTLFLKDAAGPSVAADAIARLQIKSAAGEYFNAGHLDSFNPAKVLATPGAAEVPLIWTTLGNVPVSALQHHIKWDRTTEYIKFTEVYMTPGGMVVKENSHVLSLAGQAVGAEQAALA